MSHRGLGACLLLSLSLGCGDPRLNPPTDSAPGDLPATDASVECVTGGNTCAEGHACIDGRCDPMCRPQLCGSGLCFQSNQSCVPRGQGCRDSTNCDLGRFCDSTLHRCFLETGACSALMPCPVFRDDLRGLVACSDGLCHFNDRPAPLIRDLPVPAALSVVSPTPFTAYGSTDDIEFRWAAVGGASTLLAVLDAVPRTAALIPEATVWRAARPAGADTARLSDGRLVGRAAGAPRLGPGRYYFLAQAVQSDVHRATSSLVVFSIGGNFAAPGAACTSQADCEHPSFVMSCFRGACRKLCASQGDCPTGLCQPPTVETDGLRVCVPV